MELKDTVTLFCTEEFVDVFNPLAIFKGKVLPFSEITNSGESSRRRILETEIATMIPALRVIESVSSGEKFIIADKNTDFWNGEGIRHKYPVLPVEEMGAAGNIGTTLNGTQPDQAVYAYPYFVRREIDQDERSDYLSGYEIYIPKMKRFNRGDILSLGTDYYRLKTDTWVGGAGFGIAQAVKLEDPLNPLNIAVQGVYDPVTDTHAEVVIAGVSCFVEPLKQDYEFVSPSFTEIVEGDKAISLLKADAAVKVNDLIDIYRVLSIRDNGLWITCQCRWQGDIPLDPGVTFIIDEVDGAYIVEDTDSSIYIIE